MESCPHPDSVVLCQIHILPVYELVFEDSPLNEQSSSKFFLCLRRVALSQNPLHDGQIQRDALVLRFRSCSGSLSSPIEFLMLGLAELYDALQTPLHAFVY